MKKNIIDSIENLKHHTNSAIRNIQLANIPALYELNLERRYGFSTHGFKHNLINEDSLVFVSDNIPFVSTQKRHTYCDTLEKLVESGEVLPFLLFLNHEFVKWSNIVIIKDCKYSYLIILNYDYDVEIYTKECIVVPQYVKYIENKGVMNNNTIFAFRSDNRLVTNPEEGKTYTTIDLINTDEIYHETGSVTKGIVKVKLNEEKKFNKENIILFSNGYLASSWLPIKPYGLGLFELDWNSDIPAYTRYKLFYYNKANESKDNIQNIKNKRQLASTIRSDNKVPDFLVKLNEGFDFNYDRKLSYEENVYNSLDYIMKYNSGLLNDVYKDKSNIISRVYTGTHINSKMDDNGYVTMSRRIDSDTSSHVMIFVNGVLYKGYSELKYRNKDFIFPVIDIGNKDIVEILYFKDIDNRRIKLVFDSLGDDIHIMDSSLNMDNMKLFTMNVETHEFNIERKDHVQYEIGYEYERLDNNKIKIIPENSFYYDRTLSLASKRQFRYASKIVKECTIDLALPDDFKFCNEKDKYLVFINGRKIDNENFKVTIVKPTRPFDDISTYVNIPLEKGDKIEVFYVPDRMEEIVIQPEIPLSGTIVIDKSKISYNFNKDIYLLFINGKKINPDQMVDIDQNIIKIITDVKSIKNLSIIKHVEDEDILSVVFNENRDKISEIFDTLSSEQIDKLYDGEIMKDLEEDFKSNTISMQSVMYKIINDYYMRPYINNGESFVYDFDEEFIEKDDDGNIIIRTMDATLEDKISYCESEE